MKQGKYLNTTIVTKNAVMAAARAIRLEVTEKEAFAVYVNRYERAHKVAAILPFALLLAGIIPTLIIAQIYQWVAVGFIGVWTLTMIITYARYIKRCKAWSEQQVKAVK